MEHLDQYSLPGVKHTFSHNELLALDETKKSLNLSRLLQNCLNQCPCLLLELFLICLKSLHRFSLSDEVRSVQSHILGPFKMDEKQLHMIWIVAYDVELPYGIIYLGHTASLWLSGVLEQWGAIVGLVTPVLFLVWHVKIPAMIRHVPST